VLSILILSGLAVSTYSLWALFTKRRARKRRAALLLFMTYLYQLLYLSIVGEGTPLITITFLSLGGVAIALFSEWSRPSK
jgi:type II secretory pathway pseudopilin PulG